MALLQSPITRLSKLASCVARAHSRECRTWPGVEKTRRGTCTASTRPQKSQNPSRIGKSRLGRSLRPAYHAAPPPATRPALGPRGVCHGLTSADPVLSTHARARGVGNEAGGAGRPGGVDRAAKNHFLGFDPAVRTSHSRMRGKLSGLELRSWRRVTSLRRRERCERPRQRPELQPAGHALIA